MKTAFKKLAVLCVGISLIAVAPSQSAAQRNPEQPGVYCIWIIDPITHEWVLDCKEVYPMPPRPA